MSDIFIPYITTSLNGQDQSTSIFSYEFIKNRTIYVSGEIDDKLAMTVIAQLRYLNRKSGADITMIINGPGGSVTSGMAIYDAMTGIKCDVVTICMGIAASMSGFLLAAGTKGKRYSTPNSEVMIHQPLGGAKGQATDISLVAEHIMKTKKRIAEILAEKCGKTSKKLLRDMERDNWMDAASALEYGLIDHIGLPDENEEV